MKRIFLILLFILFLVSCNKVKIEEIGRVTDILFINLKRNFRPNNIALIEMNHKEKIIISYKDVDSLYVGQRVYCKVVKTKESKITRFYYLGINNF